MDDNIIIKKFSKKYWKLSLNLCKDNEILDYLNNRFNDSSSIIESCHRIKENISTHPLCPICSKPVKYIGRKDKIFSKTCSNDYCHRKLIANEIKDTCINKYGVNYTSNIPGIKEKKQNTWKSHSNELKNDIIYRTQQTCLDRYGVVSKSQLKETVQKMKNTNLVKYGHICALRNDNVIKQCKETSIQKYGCEYPSQSNIVKSKQYKTKQFNHTFNTSKPEEQSYTLLKEKYPDIIRQYKSKEYPYACDFYIPSSNIYIECNYHWTHGNHPYNKSQDIEKIENWKSKGTKYYSNAIYVWTELDPLKRKTAKENHIKLLEFWTLEELIEWLS